MRARLRRRIFVWFGVAIFVSGIVGSVLVWSTSSGPSWRREVERVRTFASGRFGAVWDDPTARDELAAAMHRDLAVDVTLRDARAVELRSFGNRCDDAAYAVHVRDAGRPVGEVSLCPTTAHHGPGPSFLLALAGAGAVIWMAAGFITRRLTRPLDQLVRVTRDIGEGKLSSRMKLGRHETDELGELALAINEMATRIEKQLSDQKELLAAVSHEIRTPLGHMRVLLEMARDAGTSEKLVADLEREVLDVDSLVDQLLASSRLEFEQIEDRPLDPTDLARRALSRANVDESVLSVAVDVPEVHGDVTLLGRALTNLLENAKQHGGGVTALTITRDGGDVVFAVEDEGAGFAEEDLARVFDSFYRGDRRAGARAGSLGLGLSLVRRIARAHGGRAFAENRPPTGARVGISIAAETE